MNRETVYFTLLICMFVLSNVTLFLYRRSVKSWKERCDDILSDWQKSSEAYQKEYRMLQDEYKKLYQDYKELLNDCDDRR